MKHILSSPVPLLYLVRYEDAEPVEVEAFTHLQALEVYLGEDFAGVAVDVFFSYERRLVCYLPDNGEVVVRLAREPPPEHEAGEPER